MKPKLLLDPPTHVYVIVCEALGLYYIGTHTGRWEDDDRYMGSSAYLDAVRQEFKEFHFTRSLVAQCETLSEALVIETDLILTMRATSPAGLLNRSANNGRDQWLHEGYGSITDPALRARLDLARKVVRPGTIKDGDLKCLVLMKRPNGTAYSPMMPSNDRTPFRNGRTWSADMLKVYDSAPPGGLHFFCRVRVWGKKSNGKPYEDYIPLFLVETFEDEETARSTGSECVKMTAEDYIDYTINRLSAEKLAVLLETL